MKYDKVETIDDITRKERDNVYEPEAMDTPDYDYGASQEPLNAQFQVRNVQNGGGNIYMGNSSINTNAGVGQQSITGVGFKPKYITFQAYRVGVEGSSSNGYFASPDVNVSYYWHNSNTNSTTITQSSVGLCMFVQDADGNTSRGKVVSTSNDGFTIDWTILNNDVYFLYQCYG